MPTFLPRIFLLHKLFNSALLYLVPKKLRFLLPVSWFPFQSANTSNARNSNNTGVIDYETQSPTLPSSFLVIERMDQAELKRVFQMFDHNGDGRITRKELSDSLENLGMFIPRDELAQMVQKIDANGDGYVDIDEFGVLYQSIMDEKDEEQDMMEAFNVFDQNGDGHITVEELKSVLAALGLKQGRTFEDCKRMITKVDVDGDGMVDFKEFKQMMKGGGFSALG